MLSLATVTRVTEENFVVCVLCHILYCLFCCLLFIVSSSATSIGIVRADFLVLITRNVVVSVRRRFGFLWKLRIRLCYFIVAIPGSSIYTEGNKFSN